MNMKRFSELTGLSSHTLRYYEKIGLLKNIRRNNSGHRQYTQQDLLWFGFIIRLKETAMPLDQILEYAALREAGAHTAQQRLALLEAHQAVLENHIESQRAHLVALAHKVQLYKAEKIR